MSTAIASAPTSSLSRTTIVVAAVGATATTLTAAGGVRPVHVRRGGPRRPARRSTLHRRSTLPRRRFIQIAVALIALSCFAPAAAGDDVPSKIGLIAIQLLAATIIAPVLARQTTR